MGRFGYETGKSDSEQAGARATGASFNAFPGSRGSCENSGQKNTKQNAASLKRSGRRQSVQPSRPTLLFGLGSQPSHPHKLRGQRHNMLDRRRVRFGCPSELCAKPWRIEPFRAGIRCMTTSVALQEKGLPCGNPLRVQVSDPRGRLNRSYFNEKGIFGRRKRAHPSVQPARLQCQGLQGPLPPPFTKNA